MHQIVCRLGSTPDPAYVVYIRPTYSYILCPIGPCPLPPTTKSFLGSCLLCKNPQQIDPAVEIEPYCRAAESVTTYVSRLNALFQCIPAGYRIFSPMYLMTGQFRPAKAELRLYSLYILDTRASRDSWPAYNQRTCPCACAARTGESIIRCHVTELSRSFRLPLYAARECIDNGNTLKHKRCI